MRIVAALAASLIGVQLAGDTHERAPRGDWTRVVSMLQYIEADYVEAIEENSAKELEEQERMATASIGEAAAASGPEVENFVTRLRDLREAIRSKAAPIAVHETCGVLIADIARAQRVAQAPPAAPDVMKGKALYRDNCASCHGAHEGERTPIAATLDPKPPSFFVADVMNPLSPWKTFNQITHGILGTPMPAFPKLTDKERWDIAFFVFTLREPACTAPVTPVPLERVSTLSDNELVARYGEASLPCLRHAMGTPGTGGAR